MVKYIDKYWQSGGGAAESNITDAFLKVPALPMVHTVKAHMMGGSTVQRLDDGPPMH